MAPAYYVKSDLLDKSLFADTLSYINKGGAVKYRGKYNPFLALTACKVYFTIPL